MASSAPIGSGRTGQRDTVSTDRRRRHCPREGEERPDAKTVPIPEPYPPSIPVDWADKSGKSFREYRRRIMKTAMSGTHSARGPQVMKEAAERGTTPKGCSLESPECAARPPPLLSPRPSGHNDSPAQPRSVYALVCPRRQRGKRIGRQRSSPHPPAWVSAGVLPASPLIISRPSKSPAISVYSAPLATAGTLRERGQAQRLCLRSRRRAVRAKSEVALRYGRRSRQPALRRNPARIEYSG